MRSVFANPACRLIPLNIYYHYLIDSRPPLRIFKGEHLGTLESLSLSGIRTQINLESSEGDGTLSCSTE